MGAAIVIAVGSLLGACAPAEEGVLITIRTPDGNGFEPVGTLELFLGGSQDPAIGDRRIRQVLDELGGDDLRPVDGALDGYTIFLQGIPADVRIAAVAAFAGEPLEPEDYPVALGTSQITFTPGELTSVELTVRAVNSTLDRQAVRWRGQPIAEPPVGHSCLAWTLSGGALEQIVRADDYDCDGTLPIACSDINQADRHIPDDLPRQDLDGDGYSTCDACTSPFTGRDVACDCNDDPNQNGGAQNAFQPELCDGIDNDCDDQTLFVDAFPTTGPCLQPLPNGACEVGVIACDERLDNTFGDLCRPTTTTLMEPCGVDLGGPTCGLAETCPVTVVDEPQLITCAAEYAKDTGCGGSTTIAELIENLDPAPGFPLVPATCTAMLWGTDDTDNNWGVRLADLNQTDERVIFDKPCNEITVYLVSQGGPGQSHGVIVLAFDSLTGERFALPVSFHSTTVGPCSLPPMTCAPPQ